MILNLNNVIRNNLWVILIFILKYLKLSSPLMVVLIFNFNKHKILIILALLLYGLIILSYSFIKWFNIKFILNKNNINYTSGILFKNSIKIPLSKLTTIKIQQSLIQKIFNLYSFSINIENVNTKISKIKMLLKKDVILNMHSLIKENKIKLNYKILKQPKNILQEPLFEISKKDLILFALTGNNIIFGISVIIAIQQFLKKLEKYLNFHIVNKIDPIVNLEVIYKTYGIYMIYIILGLLIIFFIISTIISVIQKFIKFYNFRVYKDLENIVIKYGLISKKEYILPIKKITAIKLSQNSIKQIFNLYKLKICIIGYGQEKNEEAILYPIVDEKNAKKIVNKILPEFSCNFKITKSPKKAISKFFTLPISIFLLIYFVITIINYKFRILIFLLPILLLSRYLNYKNVSIGFNKNILLATNRGFYKNILILKTYKIQSIETKSTYFQRRKKLCSYKINYPKGNITLKNLDDDILINLKNIM